MNRNLHSIQKVFLEIDTNSMRMADSIQNNLTVFLQNELFPILEKQFNNIKNTDNQTIQIEKLEFSIDSSIQKNNVSFFNTDIKTDIKNQIEKEIQKNLQEFENKVQIKTNGTADTASEMRLVSPEEKQIKTLLYFIENGTLPWWVTKADEISFFEDIPFTAFKNENFKSTFLKLIRSKKVQERIINQFSNTEIAFLGIVFTESALNSISISEISPEKFSTNLVLKAITKQSHLFKTIFWQPIFEVWSQKNTSAPLSYYYKNEDFFLSEKISLEAFISSIKEFAVFDFTEDDFQKIKTSHIIPKPKKTIESQKETVEKIEKTEIEKTVSKEIISEETEIIQDQNKIKSEVSKNDLKTKKNIDQDEIIDTGTSCYVQNAGLVILHPFIKELFKNCELLDKDNKLTNKELAAHILHYAASKKENDYEHAMLFEKFLCGIPLNESIKREIKIDNEHKKHIEEMLNAVVEHWSALKNTSIDVLRSEFLQREGKLDWSETNPKLTIERKTQDLLLEKIPWNISIVKIPWIEKLIYIQW